MPTYTPISCADVYDRDAPECDSCEGTGTEAYLHGPYEVDRECAECHGIGRRLDCPACDDGVNPATGDTCDLCDGFGALY
ncbi:hypothetical protein OG730_04625 [Streptomyces sp. NBC_01298]|uniref:hypothetical protein n=1 Tax=Streptomyces sp. NBC_01298 TaxID=2903817 RepID=UPI002E14F758|nr:hypothetical protein OG730_04625 [Streptomyces sp. NBC_01298]